MSLYQQLEQRLADQAVIVRKDDKINITPISSTIAKLRGDINYIPPPSIFNLLYQHVTYVIAPKGGLYKIEQLKLFRDYILPPDDTRMVSDFYIFEYGNTKVLRVSEVKYKEPVARAKLRLSRQLLITDPRLLQRDDLEQLEQFTNGSYTDEIDVEFDSFRYIDIVIYPSEEIARTVLDPDYKIGSYVDHRAVQISLLEQQAKEATSNSAGRLSLMDKFKEMLGLSK